MAKQAIITRQPCKGQCVSRQSPVCPARSLEASLRSLHVIFLKVRQSSRNSKTPGAREPLSQCHLQHKSHSSLARPTQHKNPGQSCSNQSLVWTWHVHARTERPDGIMPSTNWYHLLVLSSLPYEPRPKKAVQDTSAVVSTKLCQLSQSTSVNVKSTPHFAQLDDKLAVFPGEGSSSSLSWTP